MKELLNNVTSKKIIIPFLFGTIFSFALIVVYCSIFYKNTITIDLSENKIIPSKDNPIVAVATNDDIEVYLSEVQTKINLVPEFAKQGVLFNNLNKEAQNLIIKDVIADKLLTKKLLNSDIIISKRKLANIQKDLIKKIQNNELNNGTFNESILLSNSYNIIKNQALNQLKQAYIIKNSNISVSEKDVKAKYDELVLNLKGKKEYKVKHILVKTKKEATNLINKLNKSSFNDIAKKYSIDDSTKNNGGDLGYIPEGSMVQEFDNQIKKLKKNKLSRPFKTNMGWHIIKVEEIRDAVPASFEDAKEKIRSSIAANNSKNYMKNLVEEIGIKRK